MEGKPHTSNSYTPIGQLSRVKQDLLSCSKDFLSFFQQSGAERSSAAASERPHVAIIGAGLAGLRCAEVLISKGAKVTVLEARQRIGGRIHQENLLDRAVDMGPNWIHGASNNPITKLAKETNTPLVSIDDNTRVYDPQGLPISSEVASTGFEKVWDLISDAFKHSNDEHSTIPSNKSLKDFFHEKLLEQSLSHNEKNFIMLIAEMWGSFIGDPWEKQSLEWFWMEECLDGDNLFVANSHRSILQRVAKSVLTNGDVRLGTTVETIENIAVNGDPKVLVKGNNYSFAFDEVVVAVPLGCLKRGKPAFIPAITTKLRDAIDNASYSTLEKVYITFPVDFWDSVLLELQPFKGHPLSTGSQLPSFFHFLSPEYVPDQQKFWPIELAPLSSSAHFGRDAQPTLLFTLYGPCAAHVTSLIRQLSPTSSEYYNTLVEFFRPYYSLLPNYRANHPDCIPSAVLATNWQNDDLAGNGSYANFQVRSDTDGEAVLLDAGIRVMRAGMPERGIWFAGEHTAPFVALGTSTGAYWSGESVGVRILVAKGLL